MVVIIVWQYSSFTVHFSTIVALDCSFPVYEKAKIHCTSPSLSNLVISDLKHCAGKKVISYCRLFFQVVECCHYFSKQTGAHETALVTLLTGQKSYVSGGGTKDEASKGFSSLGVAKAAGDSGLWLILLPLSVHAVAAVVLMSVLKLELMIYLDWPI
jgi:hypothetical protein